MTLDLAISFVLAVAIGFLVGRTRSSKIEPEDSDTSIPGIRDFVIIATAGCVSAIIDAPVMTAIAAAGLFATMLLMRFQHPERTGLTTEFAAVVTFLLGYLCPGPYRTLAAAAGILLAAVLAKKERLHSFAFHKISQTEFDDTLRFLALIFIVYPLLPEGKFGPYEFFEPRKIWLFVILVCAVSYIGYFLVKFVGTRRGIWLTAILGGLASTTAYTGGVSRDVRERPENALAFAGTTLMANSIMFPRMALILAAISMPLLMKSLPALAAMTLAGMACAWILGGRHAVKSGQKIHGHLANPFSLWPALKFGMIFTAVLFLTRAGRAWLGSSGELATAGVGGLLDVDAVLLSLAESANQQGIPLEMAVLGILIAGASNAIFKSILAISSRVPGFYLRILAGFLLMFAAGFAVYIFVKL